MKVFKTSILLIPILCSLVCAAPPKNVIFYIGDGMGFEQVEAAEIYTGSPMFFNVESNFPFTADCTTNSLDGLTDSAAAGTALATATKVANGVISMAKDENGQDIELFTLLEQAQAQGKSVGLITTVYLTHATPATFGAHDWSRNNTDSIGQDYITQTFPNILFGGGGYGLTTTNTSDCAVHYMAVNNSTDFALIAPDGDPASPEFFAALFGNGYMPRKVDYLDTSYPYPFLNEMTTKALQILSENPNGFFLMVEGGQIDTACHSNDIQYCVHEVLDFNDAVRDGYAWVQTNVPSDTLILVTADHETGGLHVDGTVDDDGYPNDTWTTGGHTSTPVPVYAWGVNADMVLGTMDNIDMFEVCTADNTPNPAATNPYPKNGAADIALNVTLQWTSGDGASSHTIEVWTDAGPISSETVGEALYPITCSAGTIYYWKVDEYDAGGNLIAEGTEWSFTTVFPPSAPDGLYPSDGLEVAVDIELSWNAVSNADGYRVFLGSSTEPIRKVSDQTETTYSPNLTNSESYSWYVEAFNDAGTAMSEVETFTTESLPLPEPFYAVSENTVIGLLVEGDRFSLASIDDNYERLMEVSNVPNKNGYSTLEHVWTFNIGNAVSAEFYVDAYKSYSSDGDDFVFSYSTDGVTFYDMVTITNTEDPLAAQVYKFETAPTNTVYVRVQDTDHTKGSQNMDTLWVNQMYIYASEGMIIKHYKASQPDPADCVTSVSIDQPLKWTPGEDAERHEVYLAEAEEDLVVPVSLGAGTTTIDPSTILGASLSEGKTYYWRVDEVRTVDGIEIVATGDVWRYTTAFPTTGCVPALMRIESITTTLEAGPKGTSFGVATVTIMNNCGEPVKDATVMGHFTGSFENEPGVVGTTGEDGTVTFRTTASVKKPVWTFIVDEVTHDDLKLGSF
ncbi:MAG: alkaline phosphatase [Sedimentisphaerales bacterium]|nr:alkaline phosphatase [Sedimentisphaerales bacterium]